MRRRPLRSVVVGRRVVLLPPPCLFLPLLLLCAFPCPSARKKPSQMRLDPCHGGDLPSGNSLPGQPAAHVALVADGKVIEVLTAQL